MPIMSPGMIDVITDDSGKDCVFKMQRSTKNNSRNKWVKMRA